jgi:thiosulfate/3-mercaptopyruvate sulfurtransferase
MIDSLVSADWLAGALGDPDLHVLDATYFALDPTRDARAAFESGHVPGAMFLDLEHLADPASELPGTVPPASLVSERLSALGLSNDHRIVLYDGAPHHTAFRAWWLLRLFGARHGAVLDGGWRAWIASGGAIATGPASPRLPGRFEAALDSRTLRTIAQMRTATAQIVDARSAARFTGDERDPRPGVAPGHIPGSRNLPYGALFDATGRLKDDAAIAAAFAAAGIDPAQPVVTTCGSGVTAAILAFALDRLGNPDVALYDGSWSEWGANSTTPKAIGPA